MTQPHPTVTRLNIAPAAPATAIGDRLCREAAPELLAALEPALAWLEERQKEWVAQHGTPNQVLKWRIDAAAAAIAKARGTRPGVPASRPYPTFGRRS